LESRGEEKGEEEEGGGGIEISSSKETFCNLSLLLAQNLLFRAPFITLAFSFPFFPSQRNRRLPGQPRPEGKERVKVKTLRTSDT
jgi:hypothetical protein